MLYSILKTSIKLTQKKNWVDLYEKKKKKKKKKKKLCKMQTTSSSV